MFDLAARMSADAPPDRLGTPQMGPQHRQRGLREMPQQRAAALLRLALEELHGRLVAAHLAVDVTAVEEGAARREKPPPRGELGGRQRIHRVSRNSACRLVSLAALLYAFRRSASEPRCRSSVVEHPLGKGEVVGSIPTGSTTLQINILGAFAGGWRDPLKRPRVTVWGNNGRRAAKQKNRPKAGLCERGDRGSGRERPALRAFAGFVGSELAR